MNKKLMVGALAVALTGGGIIGAALLPSTDAAASDATAPASAAPVQKAQTQQDNDKEVNDDGAQAASITKQQSIDAALKQTAGTVSDVQLETENGVAAYTVKIKDAAGTQHEVTVDATTGKVIPEND
ncbi:PepSY domain-containing protein [Paenibacillus dokdonensis]|uniref:PepSY domain-containing protein n=1 Tax=Paenibacillus dokdonensis TaxID=2567944 RepID=UPI0010A804B4|nr:PepSY domain-containing protein [Paenibacillus dokdonensis]